MKENANCSISNIYKLDGRVPIGKAIPFGSSAYFGNVRI